MTPAPTLLIVALRVLPDPGEMVNTDAPGLTLKIGTGISTTVARLASLLPGFSSGLLVLVLTVFVIVPVNESAI
jgi:hypothetical protein